MPDIIRESRAVSVMEMADMLGIGRHKAWELIMTRQIPSFKIGRLRRVSRAAVERYIAEREAAEAGRSA